MPACTHCARQQGKPARTEPHARLRIESTRIAGDSETYAYECRDCAMKWLRVIPKPAGIYNALWRNVPRLPQPV